MSAYESAQTTAVSLDFVAERVRQHQDTAMSALGKDLLEGWAVMQWLAEIVSHKAMTKV